MIKTGEYMKCILDLHTHTIASGHAYSTLSENAAAAKENGIEILGISDHAPGMPGSTHEYYFGNMRVLPDSINGVKILKGVELNILDESGKIDLPVEILKTLDYGIASIHIPCFKNLGKIGNTNALLNVMKNPFIQIIGHPDDGRYPLDYERLVIGALENNILLELNNSSLAPTAYRENARENYTKLLELCEKHKVSVILGSDAHFTNDIGNMMLMEALIDELNFPKELIVNYDVIKLSTFINFNR